MHEVDRLTLGNPFNLDMSFYSEHICYGVICSIQKNWCQMTGPEQ